MWLKDKTTRYQEEILEHVKLRFLDFQIWEKSQPLHFINEDAET